MAVLETQRPAPGSWPAGDVTHQTLPQAQLGFASQPHFLLSRNPGVDGSGAVVGE